MLKEKILLLMAFLFLASTSLAENGKNKVLDIRVIFNPDRSAEEMKKIESLPECFLLSEDDINNAIQFFYEKWNYLSTDHSLGNITNILKSIRQSNRIRDLSRDRYQYFVSYRLFYLDLRGFYELFHKSHTPPTQITGYSKNLGQIKDLLKTRDKNYKHKKKTEINKTLQMLNQDKDYLTLNGELEFQKDNPAGVVQHFNQQLLKIKDLLNQEAMSLFEFHWLRKKIRGSHLMFRVISLRKKHCHEVIRSVGISHAALGRVKDSFYKKKLKGDLKFKDTLIRIKKKDKKILNDFIQAITLRLEYE